MNKLVKKIFKQSKIELWDNNPFNGAPEFQGYEVDQEKFVQLLLTEVLNRVGSMPVDDYTNYERFTARTQMRQEIYDTVKLEFGIE